MCRGSGIITDRHGMWLSLVERCVRDAEAASSNLVIPIRIISSVGQSSRLITDRSGVQVPDNPLSDAGPGYKRRSYFGSASSTQSVTRDLCDFLFYSGPESIKAYGNERSEEIGLTQYKAYVEISGNRICYTVRRTASGSPFIRIGRNGMTVGVPESYGQAAVEKFVSDNTSWISQHYPCANCTMQDRSSLFRSNQRTGSEFESLVKNLASRHFRAVLLSRPEAVSAVFPDIRFRMMKTRLASYNREKNVLTFSGFLSDSEKDAIDLAAAYGISLVFGTPGTEILKSTFEQLCPDWRKKRKKVPERLGDCLSGNGFK